MCTGAIVLYSGVCVHFITMQSLYIKAMSTAYNTHNKIHIMKLKVL